MINSELDPLFSVMGDSQGILQTSYFGSSEHDWQTTTPFTQQPHNATNTQRIIYGEFIVLGYNGQLPEGNKGRRRSKTELCQRTKANGIIQSCQYMIEGFPKKFLLSTT